VIRTSLPPDAIGASAAVQSCKALENVERVFRGLNTDLLIRPIRHRLEDRVKAHVLIRMLACHVTWHMQQRLAPMLFKDHDPAAGRAARPSPVAPARRSPAALAKAATKAAADGGPVHSFATVLADLATIAANRIQPADGLPAFTVITTPTPGPAPRLRTPRHLPPPRLPVVRQHQITAHFRRQAPYRTPRGGNFGLGTGLIQRAPRALPAVASHAIGFAEPNGPDVHSPGFGTYRG
jgi:hypothetical protein